MSGASCGWGIAALLAIAAAGAGCGKCLIGSPSSGRICDSSGTATLAAAPGLASSKPLYVGPGGSSCFAATGCLPGLYFDVEDVQGGGPLGFQFLVSLPAQRGTATFPVAGPGVVSGYWAPRGSGTPFDNLETVSGTIEVQNASETGFSATFAFELRTMNGEPVSVTGGQAVISNCRAVTSCGE